MRDSANSETRAFNGLFDAAAATLGALLAAAFPRHHGRPGETDPAVYRKEAKTAVKDLIAYVKPDEADALADAFMAQFDGVVEVLWTDVQAAFEQDPSAMSTDEVILLFPAFKAICAYRFSHVLYTLGVPLVPRAISEVAHRETATDIHPGATIGTHFFIDHGGALIGETATVGNHVSMFSNVTLGVKSFELDENGHPKKGVKRHPDVGNNVTIYTGAFILGGTTKVGDGSVIGAQVWLTHSVGENETVTIKNVNQKR